MPHRDLSSPGWLEAMGAMEYFGEGICVRGKSHWKLHIWMHLDAASSGSYRYGYYDLNSWGSYPCGFTQNR